MKQLTYVFKDVNILTLAKAKGVEENMSLDRISNRTNNNNNKIQSQAFCLDLNSPSSGSKE